MALQAFDAYRVYQAVKLHFTSNTYDCFKYHFKTNANPKTFWKRNDKYFYHKVACRFKTEKEMADFYVAHFIQDKTYIIDMLESDEVFNNWSRKMQSISRTFELDMTYLNEQCDTFDCLFEIDGNYPIILNEFIKNKVQLETVVIVNKLTNFIVKTDKVVTEPLFYPTVSNRIKKYAPFVQVDLDKMKKIVLKTYLQ